MDSTDTSPASSSEDFDPESPPPEVLYELIELVGEEYKPLVAQTDSDADIIEPLLAVIGTRGLGMYGLQSPQSTAKDDKADWYRLIAKTIAEAGASHCALAMLAWHGPIGEGSLAEHPEREEHLIISAADGFGHAAQYDAPVIRPTDGPAFVGAGAIETVDSVEDAGPLFRLLQGALDYAAELRAGARQA